MRFELIISFWINYTLIVSKLTPKKKIKSVLCTSNNLDKCLCLYFPPTIAHPNSGIILWTC